MGLMVPFPTFYACPIILGRQVVFYLLMELVHLWCDVFIRNDHAHIMMIHNSHGTGELSLKIVMICAYIYQNKIISNMY
jgi:hypothetical protein